MVTKRSVALLAGPTLVASLYQRFYDALTTRERGRGQFPQARQSEALQERFSRGESQPTVGAGEFLDKFEIEVSQRTHACRRRRAGRSPPG